MSLKHTSNKYLKFAAGIAAVALVVAFGVSNRLDQAEDRPPQLSFGSALYQGQLTNRGLLVYEDSDQDVFDAIDWANFTPEEVRVRSGFNYYHSVYAQNFTVETALRCTNPDVGRVLFAYYSPGEGSLSQGFHLYPGDLATGLDNAYPISDPSTFEIPPGRIFAMYAENSADSYCFRDAETETVVDAGDIVDTSVNGWVQIALPTGVLANDLADIDHCLDLVWPQTGTGSTPYATKLDSTTEINAYTSANFRTAWLRVGQCDVEVIEPTIPPNQPSLPNQPNQPSLTPGQILLPPIDPSFGLENLGELLNTGTSGSGNSGGFGNLGNINVNEGAGTVTGNLGVGNNNTNVQIGVGDVSNVSTSPGRDMFHVMLEWDEPASTVLSPTYYDVIVYRDGSLQTASFDPDSDYVYRGSDGPIPNLYRATGFRFSSASACNNGECSALLDLDDNYLLRGGMESVIVRGVSERNGQVNYGSFSAPVAVLFRNVTSFLLPENLDIVFEGATGPLGRGFRLSWLDLFDGPDNPYVEYRVSYLPRGTGNASQGVSRVFNFTEVTPIDGRSNVVVPDSSYFRYNIIYTFCVTPFVSMKGEEADGLSSCREIPAVIGARAL